jgi:hypothetical protein
MQWTRGDKIAAVSVLLAALGVLAAWFVVPEFRAIFGLKPEKTVEQQGSSGTVSISGIVVDQDTNQGIGQALVVLVGRSEQSLTVDDGNFRIDLTGGVPSELRLHVSKAGFQDRDTSIEPPTNNLVIQLRRR